MTATATILPDVARPDSHHVLINQFVAPNQELQRAGASALIDVWSLVAWPDGLLSISSFLGTDGVSILHYVQWTDEAAHEAFLALDPATTTNVITRYVTDAAPGIERQTSGPYVLYRSGVNDSGIVPGCIVIVDVEFDSPDEQRQRDWVDAVFEAIADESQLPPGGLSAHFHVSRDGTRVINYAEWINEAAHVAALDSHGGRSIGEGPLWDRVRTYPGMVSSTVKRFRPYRSISGPPAAGGR